MSNPARFKRLAPQLVVQDVVATAEYYRDKLGFTILGFFADPPVFAMVRRDDVEIHFGKIDKGAEMQFNDTIRRGLGTESYIWVDDIDALYEELSEKGVDIIEGPIKRIYNCTEVVVRDCNGFQLVFAA
jgi:catechol 2,3-dioxygenase-like lactoylglutathione lyase family enzyme